jgi:hypothetical protein
VHRLSPRRCAVRYALFTFLSLLVVSNAEAQKTCRKGIPCGNTCIAANKVCHIGTPATPPTNQPAPARSDSTAVAPTSSMGWVASSRGHTYYQRGCGTANRLSPPNLIYFRTEEEAQRAGYRRSASRGC